MCLGCLESRTPRGTASAGCCLHHLCSCINQSQIAYLRKKKNKYLNFRRTNSMIRRMVSLLTRGAVCEPGTLLGIPPPLYWYREGSNQLLLCSAQEPNASDMLQHLSALEQHYRRRFSTETPATAHMKHDDFTPPAALPLGNPFCTNRCRQQHQCHWQLLNSV